MIIKQFPDELNSHALLMKETPVLPTSPPFIISVARLHGGVDVEFYRTSKRHLEVQSHQDQNAFYAVVRLSHNGGWEVSESFLTDWETFVDTNHDYRN